jgi:hypothetical protein
MRRRPARRAPPRRAALTVLRRRLRTARRAGTEATRRAAFLHRELAALVGIVSAQADQIAEARGRLLIYATRSTTVADHARLARTLAATQALLRTCGRDLADANRTLAVMSRTLADLNDWITASRTEGDLLFRLWREWCHGRSPPPRPPPPV